MYIQTCEFKLNTHMHTSILKTHTCIYRHTHTHIHTGTHAYTHQSDRYVKNACRYISAHTNIRVPPIYTYIHKYCIYIRTTNIYIHRDEVSSCGSPLCETIRKRSSCKMDWMETSKNIYKRILTCTHMHVIVYVPDEYVYYSLQLSFFSSKTFVNICMPQLFKDEDLSTPY